MHTNPAMTGKGKRVKIPHGAATVQAESLAQNGAYALGRLLRVTVGTADGKAAQTDDDAKSGDLPVVLSHTVRVPRTDAPRGNARGDGV